MHPAGGLGDVMAALPKALARRGHRVMAVVPRYSNYADVTDTGVRIRVNCFGSGQEVRGRQGPGQALAAAKGPAKPGVRP